MKRKELIEALHTAQSTESAAAVCIDNIIGTLSWTGLSDDQQSSVAALLDRLSRAANRRADRVVECIRQIEGSHNDVL